MTPQQKAEALLKSLGIFKMVWAVPKYDALVAIIKKALEDEYDEGFQNGMNRAHEDHESSARHYEP